MLTQLLNLAKTVAAAVIPGTSQAIDAAQAVRYRVFVEEMGARLNSPEPGHDIDLFDDYCEHLLVRDEASGQVVGTYRVLTPVQARRVGGLYSETEFDLTRLRALVTKAFTPRAIERMRPRIHEVADELLDAVKGQPSFDLMTAFCQPFPTIVIAGKFARPGDLAEVTTFEAADLVARGRAELVAN